MAKNTRKAHDEARKVLYDVVNEIEISNSIQIAQNNEKIEALAADIVTNTVTYSEFLGELYFKANQLKCSITDEIAAIKNQANFHDGYVLAINM